jgi:hypothetical protein
MGPDIVPCFLSLAVGFLYNNAPLLSDGLGWPMYIGAFGQAGNTKVVPANLPPPSPPPTPSPPSPPPPSPPFGAALIPTLLYNLYDKSGLAFCRWAH